MSDGQGGDDRNQKKARDYKDLQVWQKGMELTKLLYQISARFPSDQRFGLISQIRRGPVSIPSNIAEGQARHTTREFIQFVSHAEGSVAEVDTQLTLAVDLGYCSREQAGAAFALVSDLRNMLNALRRTLVRSGL